MRGKLFVQVDFDRLFEFVQASSHADQTIFFGHYPSSIISGISASKIRQLLGYEAININQ